MAVDVIIVNLAFYLSFYILYHGNIPSSSLRTYGDALPFISGLFILLSVIFGLYSFYNKSVGDVFASMLIIQGILIVFIMAFTFPNMGLEFSRIVLAIYFVTGSTCLLLWRAIAYRIYLKFTPKKRILLLGSVDDVFDVADSIMNGKSKIYTIKYIATNNYLKHVKRCIKEVDIVYLSNTMDRSLRTQIAEYVVMKDRKLYISPSYEELLFARTNLKNLEDETILSLTQFKLSPEEQIVKRVIDILLAIVCLVVTAPIMLVAALLIKLTSNGSVIYKQTRITKGNKEFSMYKFRTMSAKAERDSGPVLAMANDSRVTKVGKVLRQLRIDELPQCMNVLKGEMSFIGPRPERPYFVHQFQKEVSHYKFRHNVRAGITGYAQVYGKYTTKFTSKLNFDLIYIKKYSLLLDLSIMLLTVKILFDKIASQGVEEDMTRDMMYQVYEQRGVTFCE